MSRFQKVVWNEGMFLSPHHFQGWEHYLRDEQNARFRSLRLLNWGITEINIDKEELAGGSFSLLRCVGVMPDGLVIDIPESDRIPESRIIGEQFSHQAEKLDVFLGIPVERTDAPNYQLDEDTGFSSRETRYNSEFISINDENTGENKKDIRIGRANFKILFSGESLDNYVCLKIAELGRNATGLLELRENFILSCLYISASKRIMAILRSLLDKLSGLSVSLSQQLNQKSATQYEFHARDLETFGRLSTINSYIPVFSHYYHNAKIHPEGLYLAMVQFAGALTIFNTEVNPRDITLYSHNDLAATFNSLEQTIIKLIGGGGTSNCIPIPLQKISESIFEGEIPSELLETAQFIFAISSNIPENQIQNMLPQVIKISSPEQIDFLIQRALKGLNIVYMSRPHPAISVKVNHVYFKVDNTGDLWEGIKKTKKIAISLPAGNPIQSIELFAVTE